MHHHTNIEDTELQAAGLLLSLETRTVSLHVFLMTQSSCLSPRNNFLAAFKEHEGLLAYSQKPVTGVYPEPDKLSAHNDV